MRILIAEDETIIRLDLRELLERAGFEVVAEARDGEEAVELARSAAPELALLDVKMPRLDGKGTVQVTASIGAASLRGDDLKSKDGLVAAADAALYRAKRLGKNRAVRADPERDGRGY